MKKVIAVGSGKGGVGKTSICCHLGRALAYRGNNTIIVELDCGMRGLDLMLGMENTIYDMDDVLHARCQLDDAILHTQQVRLDLLSAPVEFTKFPSPAEVTLLCDALLTRYDIVILDTPAGCSMAKAIAKAADLILLAATPDVVCVRDVAMFATALQEDCKADTELRLIINRVEPHFLKKGVIRDLDQVIDQVGVQLIGVIPESEELRRSAEHATALNRDQRIGKVFDAIARRMEGQSIPLVIKQK